MRLRSRCSLRALVVGLIVGLLVGVSVGVAYAGTAWGGFTYYSRSGYHYKNQSHVITNTSGAIGGIGCYRWYGSTIPTGYMGIEARLYNDAGAKVAWTGWSYNPAPSDGFSKGTWPPYAWTDDYAGWGRTKAYDSSGGYYVIYGSIQSPYQSWP